MTTDEELRQHIHSRFHKGLAVELSLWRGKTAYRLVLIPSILFSEVGETGLGIACDGQGFYFWDGKNPCDVFDLASHKFRLDIAEAIAELVWALFPYRKRLKLQSPQGHNQQAQAYLENIP